HVVHSWHRSLRPIWAGHGHGTLRPPAPNLLHIRHRPHPYVGYKALRVENAVPGDDEVRATIHTSDWSAFSVEGVPLDHSLGATRRACRAVGNAPVSGARARHLCHP